MKYNVLPVIQIGESPVGLKEWERDPSVKFVEIFDVEADSEESAIAAALPQLHLDYPGCKFLSASVASHEHLEKQRKYWREQTAGRALWDGRSDSYDSSGIIIR